MDEMIKKIVAAEEEAQQIKNEAILKAQQIIDSVRDDAEKSEQLATIKRSQDYVVQIDNAKAYAQNVYDDMVSKKIAEANEINNNLLTDENVVSGIIVARIIRGN